jgi:hypothetical protein
LTYHESSLTTINGDDVLRLIFIIIISSHWATASMPQSSSLLRADPFDNGYPQWRFDFVLDTLLLTYAPIVRELGGELYLDRDWSDGAVNMWAERLGDEYWLEVPGGMARYYLISEEAFVVSLCHELGHLLGGAPKSAMISFEGQADYYATSVCAQLILSRLDIFPGFKWDEEAEQICEGLASPRDGELCVRTLSGAKSLSSLYGELEGVRPPQYWTPSAEVTTQTLSGHPKAQCRLDTFLLGWQQGPRPPCWFRPNEDQ